MLISLYLAAALLGEDVAAAQKVLDLRVQLAAGRKVEPLVTKDLNVDSPTSVIGPVLALGDEDEELGGDGAGVAGGDSSLTKVKQFRRIINQEWATRPVCII